MQKRNWREVYTHDFPKLKSLAGFLEARLERDYPRVLTHLTESFLHIEGTFTPHFMTLFVYLTSIEISTRLFEVFILDGDLALVRLLLRMIELKQGEILKHNDCVDL